VCGLCRHPGGGPGAGAVAGQGVHPVFGDVGTDGRQFDVLPREQGFRSMTRDGSRRSRSCRACPG
jgi:hypothetical protein